MADTPSPQAPRESRAARKRREIKEAATSVFLRNGYRGASVDEIAALGSVSKQTVYKHFTDKETLFAEIIRGTAEPIGELDQALDRILRDSVDPASTEQGLGELARWFIAFLTRPQVRRLRRLVIAEAGRFPNLGRDWYQDGFERGMATLASCFGELAARGRLRLDDPVLAANHFAGLVLWVPVNRVMFSGDEEQLTDAELDHYATMGVRAFLAAYG